MSINKIQGEAKTKTTKKLAAWVSQEDVRVFLRDEYNIKVSIKTVRAFAWVHREEIEAERERYLADFNTLPLAHRKERVRELSVLYAEAAEVMEKPDLKSGARRKSMYYAIECLKNIREEMAPVEPHLAKGTNEEVEALIESTRKKGFGGRVEPKATDNQIEGNNSDTAQGIKQENPSDSMD